MTKDDTLSLRIDRKLSDKLARRARQAKRSKSSLAAYAIENFLLAKKLGNTERDAKAKSNCETLVHAIDAE
ncbi:MAG: hypothetical protein J0H30_08140 [Alphaproteobacteria bacterium]|nr:hypothetical protein [Alphaproteobacteria bacterium]